MSWWNTLFHVWYLTSKTNYERTSTDFFGSLHFAIIRPNWLGKYGLCASSAQASAIWCFSVLMVKNENLTNTKLLISTVKRINHSKYLCSTSKRVRQRNCSQLSHRIALHHAHLVRGETQHSGKQSSTSAIREGPWRHGLDFPCIMLTAGRNRYIALEFEINLTFCSKYCQD